jgi:hypothetical protein
MKMSKTIITVLLLLCILITQSGCLAIALGALTGMALGEMGNNIDRNKAAEQRRIQEEYRKQREHEIYMERLRQ